MDVDSYLLAILGFFKSYLHYYMLWMLIVIYQNWIDMENKQRKCLSNFLLNMLREVYNHAKWKIKSYL